MSSEVTRQEAHAAPLHSVRGVAAPLRGAKGFLPRGGARSPQSLPRLAGFGPVLGWAPTRGEGQSQAWRPPFRRPNPNAGETSADILLPRTQQNALPWKRCTSSASSSQWQLEGRMSAYHVMYSARYHGALRRTSHHAQLSRTHLFHVL